MKELGKRSIEMEALLIIGALAAGAHYMTKDEDPVQTVHSSQTTEEISNFGTDDTRAKIMAQIDWSKVGNLKVGDSPETGVQWVFITGVE